MEDAFPSPAAISQSVTYPDSNGEPPPTPRASARAWLSLALLRGDCTRLSDHIRRSHPDPRAAGAVLQARLDGQSDELAQLLASYDKPVKPSDLDTDAVRRNIERSLAWEQQSPEHHLLGMDHPAYPHLLTLTERAPPLLFARGDPEALARPLLAVVGSRKASHGALSHTRRICSQLAAQGLGIVSGLALGVDAVAHQAALECRVQAGSGTTLAGPTIAVAATAPDRVYPGRHADLAARIVANGGLIIGEQPLGTPVRPWCFPRRNRIISGISLGVLVTEAGLPSGTLTTATHALEQGREVMAIPGSLHNPLSRGCHFLIKQGAALVEDPSDVLDTLGDQLQRELARLQAILDARGPGIQGPGNQGTGTADAAGAQPGGFAARLVELTARQRSVYELLAEDATLDELLTLTGMPVPELASVLGILEIRGLITTTSGGRYAHC